MVCPSLSFKKKIKALAGWGFIWRPSEERDPLIFLSIFPMTGVLHAVLFPSVRLLVLHPHNTRRRTLNVSVTHPGTNAHNCSLTSRSDHTTIFPLGQRYSSKVSGWTPTVTRIPGCHHYASQSGNYTLQRQHWLCCKLN